MIHMNDGENKFNDESVGNFHKALDAVEGYLYLSSSSILLPATPLFPCSHRPYMSTRTTGPCALVFAGEGSATSLAHLSQHTPPVIIICTPFLSSSFSSSAL